MGKNIRPPPNNVQRRLFLFSLAAFILAANEKEKNAANKWPNQMVEKSAAAKASAEKNEKSAFDFGPKEKQRKEKKYGPK